MIVSTKKIASVNGLRGIAILGVMYHHLLSVQWSMSLMELAGRWGMPTSVFTVFFNGNQGVRLFFFLSGFVLTLTYALGDRRMDNASDVREFYRRRAQRLLPLFALAVLVGMIFVAPGEPVAVFWKNALLMVSTLYTFTDLWMPVYNFVLWSLATEIHFSILFPLLLMLYRRCGVWQTSLAVVLLTIFFRLQFIFLFDGTVHFGPMLASIFGRLDDFAWGMLVAFLFARRTIPRFPGMFLIGVCCTFVGFVVMDLVMRGAPPRWVAALPGIPMNIGFALILLSVLQYPHGLFAKLLSLWPLQMMGLMTYSLFIWHGTAIERLQPLLSIPNFLRYLVLVFALSWITYRYVEFGHVRDVRELLPERKRS